MKRKGIFPLLASLSIIATGIILVMYSIGIKAKPHIPMTYIERNQITDLGTLVGLLLMVIGLFAILRDLKQLAVLRRMDDDEDVYARWSYEPKELESIRDKALKESVWHYGALTPSPFISFGYVKALCFAVGASMFISLITPKNIFIQLLIWLAINAGSFISASWISKKRRIWAIRNDPGEVFVARGGVWFMGQLIELNSEQWLDSASVTAKEDGFVFVLHRSVIYQVRRTHGLYWAARPIPRKLIRAEHNIPIPEGWVEEAKDAARKLNDNPY